MSDQQVFDALKSALANGLDVTQRDVSIDGDQVTITVGLSAGTLLSALRGGKVSEAKKDDAGKQKWSEDVRREAVKLKQEGFKISEIATKLGVPESTVRGWFPKQKRAREEEDDASDATPKKKKDNDTNEVIDVDSSHQPDLNTFYPENTKSCSVVKEAASSAASASPDRKTDKARSPSGSWNSARLSEEKI